MEDLLRSIVGHEPSIELGQVVLAQPVDPYVPGGGAILQLMLQPGNRPCEARWASPFAGPLAGLLAPMPVPGQEVVVAIPRADPRSAVVIGFLHGPGGGAVRPPTWNPLTLRVQNPAGIELRSAEGLPADGLVLGTFLGALHTYLTAINSFLGVVAASDMSPAVAAAAGLVQASTATFLATLGASAAFVDPDSGGLGGPPYASALVRATA